MRLNTAVHPFAMEALLDSAKQIALAHREAQRQVALQTDLDMLENGDSIAAALELEEQDARNGTVEALEEAIRKGVALDEAEEQQQESQRQEGEDTALALKGVEEMEAEREEHRLRLIAVADEVVAVEMSNQVRREEKRVVALEARSQKLALKVLVKEDLGVAMQLAKEIEEQASAHVTRRRPLHWHRTPAHVASACAGTKDGVAVGGRPQACTPGCQ